MLNEGSKMTLNEKIQGFRGTRVCKTPFRHARQPKCPDQANEMGFFKDSANAEMFEVFISFSRFILDHELK